MWRSLIESYRKFFSLFFRKENPSTETSMQCAIVFMYSQESERGNETSLEREEFQKQIIFDLVAKGYGKKSKTFCSSNLPLITNFVSFVSSLLHLFRRLIQSKQQQRLKYWWLDWLILMLRRMSSAKNRAVFNLLNNLR